jgi:hypothetical protein
MRFATTRLKIVDMVTSGPDWKSNQDFAVGKGATVQRYAATVGKDRFEIDVARGARGICESTGIKPPASMMPPTASRHSAD